MYLKIIILCFLTSCSSIVIGQNRFFKTNLRLGGTFSQVDGDRIGGYNKIGLYGGIGIFHSFDSEKKQLGFEIIYTQKGSKKTIDPKDPNPNIFELYFNYIEFPILYKIDASFMHINNLALYVGPSIGVNIAAKRDEGFGKNDININTFETSLNFGIEYNFTKKLALDVRHSYSLIRIGDNFANGLNIFNRVGLYNRLFSIAVIYSLGKE